MNESAITRIKFDAASPSSRVLNPATGFISSFDYTINPYVGCQFGCQYCYAINFVSDETRKADWGNWVSQKDHAAKSIYDALYRPSTGQTHLLDDKTIYISTSTDPYQPIEKQSRITEAILEVLAGRRTPPTLFPTPPPRPRIVIQTRSPLVARDSHLFNQIMTNDGRVQVNMTVTTDSEAIRKAFEPKTMTNHARITAVSRLSEQGIPTCITLTPWLGADHDQQFIDTLMNSGARRFIIQKFHPLTAGPFMAKTNESALPIRDAIYQARGTDYDAAYASFKAQLLAAIASNRLTFAGEGKTGFSPPWD